ncbi:hypothetical protein [Alistipes finegoldii]|uniref:hypothetical protein n=1 Tax=Alistipes finegoldii TaxID=214856 RepID=UPI003A8CF5AF
MKRKQLSVMLLISVIKYLIVMPDVKDLAQAAQGAAAAPESVNIVEPTTSVNQPVQPTVDAVTQTPQVDTDNQSSAQVETIDDVVRRICTDGHSYVMTTVITNIDCQERTGRNGKSYLNAFVTIASPVKGAQSMPDGTHRMGMLGAIQMPFNQILLVMRKDKFYGRFVNYVGEAAEAGFASMYLTGVAVKVLCQFVPAGVQDRNPFTRKDNLYNVVDYDRYVYHIVGIEQPADPVLVGAYNVLIKQIMEDARAAIAAKREAKAKVASFVATAMNDDDLPF